MDKFLLFFNHYIKQSQLYYLGKSIIIRDPNAWLFHSSKFKGFPMGFASVKDGSVANIYFDHPEPPTQALGCDNKDFYHFLQ